MTDTTQTDVRSDLPPLADENGEQLAPTTIDGLCFIGTVTKVEQVQTKDGRYLPDLANVTVQGSKTTERLQLARRERTLNGDVLLPAFDKLIYGTGKTFCISVGGAPYIAASGKAYSNYTAIDAIEL